MGIMQEMQENHEKCRITDSPDGSISVTIRKESIVESLKGKLSDDDILKGSSMTDKAIDAQLLNTSLYRQCNGIECTQACHSLFRSIPNGNSKARIMLLNKMPTQYESCIMCSHADSESIFLSLILSRIQMDRSDVYCTDVIKCCCNDLDEKSFRACIDSYLIKEIVFVQPEIILCNGIAVLKTLDKLGYIEGLPHDTSYGNIYDVVIGGVSLKIMAIFDLEKVLLKEGNDLTECKGKLWIQILNAYNAIGGQT